MLRRLRLFLARGGLERSDSALIATLALIAAQLVIAIEGFNADGLRHLDAGWAHLPTHRGVYFRLFVLEAALFLFFARARLWDHFQALRSASATYARRRPLTIQLASFGLAVALAIPVFTLPFPWSGWEWPVTLAWCAAMIGALVCSLLVIAPATYWRQLVHDERRSLAWSLGLVAAYVLVLREWLSAIKYELWSGELATVTLHATHTLLSLTFPQVELIADQAILGVGDFRVVIEPECSGIEGMSLLLLLMGVYLYTFRRYLRFPHALVLPVIAIPMALSLNVVRIAILVSIGATISPRLALQGFHVYGGVVLLVIECGVLWLLSQSAWFSRNRPAGGFELDPESALLIPLLALLAATLLTGPLTIDFDWSYPLRVLVVGGAIWICRKPLRALACRPGWLALVAGCAVFPLWLWMVPADGETDRVVAGHLESLGPGLAAAWIAFRITGAAILIPIAEELAFRGYVIRVLTRGDASAPGPAPIESPPFQWPALLLSSLAFGALHGNWVAGTVAGLVYGAVRYRSGRLADAIAAHAVTNALLAFYVLGTGRWSYL